MVSNFIAMVHIHLPFKISGAEFAARRLLTKLQCLYSYLNVSSKLLQPRHYRISSDCLCINTLSHPNVYINTKSTQYPFTSAWNGLCLTSNLPFMYMHPLHIFYCKITRLSSFVSLLIFISIYLVVSLYFILLHDISEITCVRSHGSLLCLCT